MNQSDRKALGSYLKFIADQQNITQHQLASRLDCERTSISKVFAGQLKTDPPYARLAELFELSLDDALERAHKIIELIGTVSGPDIEPEPEAYVIALATQKGGTAKTTTAINLSLAFSDMGHRTLLIDMDPQGNATKGVGLESKSQDGSSLTRVLRGEADISELVILETDFGLDLIAGGPEVATAQADMMIDQEGSGMLRLDRIVRALRPHYDRIIIDSPPGAGILQGASLVAADGIVAPVDSSDNAIQGAERVAESVEALNRFANPDLAFLGVVLTKFNKSLSHCHLTRNYFDKNGEMPRFRSIIGVDAQVTASESKQTPLLRHNPSSRAAKHYTQLARELEEVIDGRS